LAWGEFFVLISYSSEDLVRSTILSRKVSTKRKIGEDANGATGSKIRTKYEPGMGRGAVAAAARGARAKISSTVPTADLASKSFIIQYSIAVKTKSKISFTFT
jgi:hypothetical protein